MKLTWADSLHRHVPDWFKIIMTLDICAILIFTNIVGISRTLYQKWHTHDSYDSSIMTKWLINLMNNKFEAHWIQKFILILADYLDFKHLIFSRKGSTDLFCMPEMELVNQIMWSVWEYRKTASYVTLNKTNLWPDKVRDPSYCKGGWWKLENRKSPGGSPFRRSQFYLRSRSNWGTRYNSYNTRIITFLQIYEYVHACYLSIEYIFYFPFKIFS